jgi:TRAP-type C4-dicarboxylate transport system substrate-binding protein
MSSALALAVCIALTACGSSSETRAPEPAAATDDAGPSRPGFTRRIATLAPPGTPWMRILSRGAKELSEATGGRVKVDFYFGGTQGDERDMIRKIRLEQLDGAALTSVGLGLVYPGIRVLQLPFLFDSVEELDYVRERVWPYFQERFRERGFELREPSDVGWIHLFSQRAIKSSKDLREVKMWLWNDDPIASAMFERAGVDGVPLGVPDVLPSLKTGRIDGAYGSPLAAVALQWYTEITHVTSMRVSYGIGGMVMRAEVWTSTSEADRAAETRISQATGAKLTARIRKDNERALAAMKSSGVTVVETPPKLVAKFEADAKKVWEQLVGDVYSREELDMVLRYRAEFRALPAVRAP